MHMQARTHRVLPKTLILFLIMAVAHLINYTNNSACPICIPPPIELYIIYALRIHNKLITSKLLNIGSTWWKALFIFDPLYQLSVRFCIEHIYLYIPYTCEEKCKPSSKQSKSQKLCEEERWLYIGSRGSYNRKRLALVANGNYCRRLQRGVARWSPIAPLRAGGAWVTASPSAAEMGLLCMTLV